MFSANTLIDKLNTLISSGSLTENQLLQAFGAIESLEQKGVYSVYYETDLPLASLNEGRFIFIESTGKYVFSNGSTWSINNILINFDVNGYSWGSAAYGRLGNNTSGVSRSSPVSLFGTFTDWIQLNTGPISIHTLALRANGTAWAWGQGTSGRLGDGTATARSSPVSVIGGFTDWIQVSAGTAHSLGLRANGTAWAWGEATSGKLGDGTATVRSSPVSVVGGFTDWIQVSAGGAHSLGLRANGTAWAWGSALTGRLGDGTIVSKSSPVSVVGGFTDWIQVSAGDIHSLGLRANGTIWSWGSAQYGRLGDNTTVSKSSPVSVVGGFTDWVQVSAGGYHSLALRANGTVWGWGRGFFGNIGNNSNANISSPVSVVGGFTDWVQVSAGFTHSIAIRSNGTAWTWGQNNSGQLGDNNGAVLSRSSPVSVVGGFTDWIQVSAASAHSVGVTR